MEERSVAVLLGDARDASRELVTTVCCGFQVAYYNQATPGYLNYVTANIAGLSSNFYSTFEACERFLMKNKDDITVGLQNL